MKRRGFLGFLGGLPFAAKALAEPRPSAPPTIFGEGHIRGALPTIFGEEHIRGAPTISFTNDTETGVYRTGAESIGISVGGKVDYT